MIKRLREYFARRRIRGMFGSYISPQLVERMLAAGKTPELDARETELTPIFANLENYVGIAEQVPLAQLPELMNAYFTACTDALDEQGATLDKFVGDAVVAMCGAPVPQPDHALRGCLAALRIQDNITALRARLAAEAEDRWPEHVRHLRVRIGLHTGTAIVGNLGTTRRFNYTMMGDNVNLAARLEAAGKSWGAPIICSGETKTAAEQHGAGRVLFRPLGAAVVVGRVNRVELFEPVALRERATPELVECLRVYGEGFACYRAGDWAGAAAQFEASARLEREQPGVTPRVTTNPSHTLLQMAREGLTNPTDPLRPS